MVQGSGFGACAPGLCVPQGSVRTSSEPSGRAEFRGELWLLEPPQRCSFAGSRAGVRSCRAITAGERSVLSAPAGCTSVVKE